MGQGSGVGRFLLEALVIVSSILLAFGIDAWWDERRDRAEEAEVLAGLHREFVGYRDQLRRGIEQQGEMLEAMAAVLTAVERGEWTSTEWGPDEAIGLPLTPSTSDHGNGVRGALVQGGRLELVPHALLRERVAQWPPYYEELLGRSGLLTATGAGSHHPVPDPAGTGPVREPRRRHDGGRPGFRRVAQVLGGQYQNL